MTRIILLLLLCTATTTAQMSEAFDFKAFNKEDGIHVHFKNTNSDGFYLDGKFMYSYGKLILTQDELLLLLEEASKLIRKSEGILVKDLYTLEKYDFSKDEVFLVVKEKIGSITKDKLKELKEKYED